MFASTHGHTAAIADRTADVLRATAATTDVCDVRAPSLPSPARYDLVIVGGSIHRGHHQRELVDWTRHHAATLNLVPSAFFSVSLASADDSDEARAATQEYLDDFEDETGWLPRLRVAFAGALQYREYDFPTRLAMRLLMAHGGHPTDISRDFVYTDWAAVDAFAHRCAELRRSTDQPSGRARMDSPNGARTVAA
jgi:menaquinone-dependent protoporphyrinogen oxidase